MFEVIPLSEYAPDAEAEMAVASLVLSDETELQDAIKIAIENKKFFLFKIFILLTASVTISAPYNLSALEHSDILLYLPVPTIKREVNFFFAIINLSFFNLTTSNKMNYFHFIIFF